MKSLTDVVSGAGLAGYAEIALLIFFLVFIAVGVRLFFSATSLADAARMPLDDEPAARTTPTASSPTDVSRGPV
jgi:hypothetical protein